jgi:hypothetical protein
MTLQPTIATPGRAQRTAGAIVHPQSGEQT